MVINNKNIMIYDQDLKQANALKARIDILKYYDVQVFREFKEAHAALNRRSWYLCFLDADTVTALDPNAQAALAPLRPRAPMVLLYSNEESLQAAKQIIPSEQQLEKSFDLILLANILTWYL